MMSLKELIATKSSVTYAIMALMIWFGSVVVGQFELYAPVPIQNMVLLLSLILLLLMSRKTDQSENKSAITPDFLIPLEKVSNDLKIFQSTIQDMLRAQPLKDDSTVKLKSDTQDRIEDFLELLVRVKEYTDSLEPESKTVEGLKSEPEEGGTVG